MSRLRGMIRAYALWAGMILMSTSNSTARAADHITLLPDWKVGDKVRLEMSSERQKIAGETETLIRRVRRETDLEVTEIEGEAFGITWTDHNYNVETGAAGPVAEPPIQAFADQPIKLRISKRGEILEVVDWQLVRELTLEAQSKVSTAMRKAGRSIEQIDSARKAVEQAHSSEERIRAIWANREGTYFFFYGNDIPTVGGLEQEGKVPLPIGNVVLPSKMKILAQAVDGAPGRVSFRYEQSIDAAEAAKAVFQAMQEITRQAGRDPNRLKQPEVAFKHEIIAEADLASGWVRSLQMERRTVIKGTPLSQVERMSFRLMDGETKEIGANNGGK